MRFLYTLPLLLSAAFLPALAGAEPFATVVNARDAADGVSSTAPMAAPGVAPVTDARETMPLPPPPAIAAAPVEEPIGVTDPLAPATPTVEAPSATLPPLVKKPVAQSITRPAPDVLLVQPAPAITEAPLATNGTVSGRMFSDHTETLTPNGIIDDQPDPKGTFSFGGGAAAEPAAPLTPEAPEVSATAAGVAPAEVSASAPAPVSPSGALPVRVVSPVTVVSPVAVVSDAAPATPVRPLTQPIAAGLVFAGSDTALSANASRQLATFARLAGGNVLKTLTLTQRVAAPVGDVPTQAQGRREALLEALKTAGVIDDTTRVSEVRLATRQPTSKVTLVGK